MSKRLGLVMFLAVAALFLFANRAAYRGYFQDDEFDTLSWARYGNAGEYLKAGLSPLFQKDNFRPTGHFYFFAMERLAGLDFPKYVAALHFLHLFNVWLIWMLVRRLGAPPGPAALGTLFFALHMALFDAVWKPMYVYDVLCATFCLVSILLYSQRRWILSFVAFWLAYKAKELAVMLPVALAAYEFWFGERRWKLLIPFFAASVSFGMQGLLLNPNQDNEYTFRFTLSALAKTTSYYAERVFLLPYAGFLLPLVLLIRGRASRRLWFGLAVLTVFFLPLLFLPGRIFAAYCYLPFTGLALALSAVAEMVPTLWVGIFLLIFLRQDVHALRVQQRATLARDNDIRIWAGTLIQFNAQGHAVDRLLVDGEPEGFACWGVEGAAKYIFQRLDLKFEYGSESVSPGTRTVQLRWHQYTHHLDVLQK